ncbi:hypothetical protein AB0M80_03140 [Amycolatopsis sp. NPDC051045]|uniref:hypothetical protein n=1 Tax=Amycolatopsis sp. NPDC051045 TaxID=3156922 RepID=UPI003434A440
MTTHTTLRALLTAAPIALAAATPAACHAPHHTTTTTAGTAPASPTHPPTTTAPPRHATPARPAGRWVVYALTADYQGDRFTAVCTHPGVPEPLDRAATREVRITEAQYDRYVDEPDTSRIPCPG